VYGLFFALVLVCGVRGTLLFLADWNRRAQTAGSAA